MVCIMDKPLSYTKPVQREKEIGMTVKVLFVCAGNICRSPMAEAIFTHLVEQAGLADQFSIDSAGTTSYHVGQSAHSGTLKTLTQNGIPYNGRARHLTGDDLEKFDYVIAMDDENLEDIQALGVGKAEIYRLLDFAPEQEWRQVPDPYYNNGFELVYQLVTEGARGLLAHIRKEHQL